MRLSGKVAIVTGGSQGIGEAISRAFGREGAGVVVVNHRSPERGEAVAASICEAGGTASAYRCDVSRKAELEGLVADVQRDLGSIDICVANAGVMINKSIEDYSEEDWDLTQNVNLKGCFLTAQAVIGPMRRQGSGKLIFIGSIAGTHAFPNSVAYCASKGGVLMIAKSLAAEVARDGINVNCISPGNTATPLNEHLQRDPAFVKTLEQLTPSGRAYIPVEEIAGAAVFLASDEARAVHGIDLVVDDGWCAV